MTYLQLLGGRAGSFSLRFGEFFSTSLQPGRENGCFVVETLQEKPQFCRRRSSRFESPNGVWVCWRSAGIDDVSRVQDLSVGGLFLATDKTRQQGAKVKVEFLVQEGQIRVEAEVRRAEASNRLGLKFTAIGEQDRHRLAALLARLRSHRTDIRKKAVG